MQARCRRALLDGGLAEAALAAIRKHERTGRPLGSEPFLTGLEARLGRQLKRSPPGPKPRKTAADGER
jgi:putative transposase